MALIDEYKQAIKDVLDGRAPEAPNPAELPLTEDKLATLYAAAAAELLAEANIPPAPEPELPDAPSENGAYVLTATVSSGGVALSWESAGE